MYSGQMKQALQIAGVKHKSKQCVQLKNPSQEKKKGKKKRHDSLEKLLLPCVFLIFCYAQRKLIVNQLGSHNALGSGEGVNEED